MVSGPVMTASPELLGSETDTAVTVQCGDGSALSVTVTEIWTGTTPPFRSRMMAGFADAAVITGGTVSNGTSLKPRGGPCEPNCAVPTISPASLMPVALTRIHPSPPDAMRVFKSTKQSAAVKTNA